MTDELPSFKPGDSVEGFRVMSELGRGAASIVYLVQDPKTKQIWALKHVVKRDAKEQRFLDQAEIEYRIASSIDHDSIRKIPRIIKKGSLLRANELFMLMEFVDGVSMHEESPATLEQTVDLLRQTSAGLAEMHRHGYVHADMKPHNVIVGADIRGNLSAKLIDLGQSCKIGTVKKRIQGTPDYISPEQVRREAITPRTDIYNFGATMYFVLTGKNIPTAMGAKNDSLTGSAERTRIEKPTPIHELRDDLPERLCDTIMRCIEIEPAKRPESMDEVTKKLDLALGILRAPAMQGDEDFDDGETRF